MDNGLTAKQIEQRYQQYHVRISQTNRRTILQIDEPSNLSNLPRMVNWILAYFDGQKMHVNLTPHVANQLVKAYTISDLQVLLQIINDFCQFVKYR